MKTSWGTSAKISFTFGLWNPWVNLYGHVVTIFHSIPDRALENGGMENLGLVQLPDISLTLCLAEQGQTLTETLQG